MCSAYGRGIPDVSAQAVNFTIVFLTNTYRVSGTSAAAPVCLTSLAPLCVVRPRIQLIASLQTVAGIISLLNDFLISEGKDPLGFLNPWLYGDGLAGLNDIKSGSSMGCDGYGFNAI